MFGSLSCGGGNRIKSRANDLAITAYYLDFPQHRLNFHKLRKVIKSSEITDDEKKTLEKLLTDAKDDWKTRIVNTIKKIHNGFGTDVEVPINDTAEEDTADFDPELATGSSGSIQSEIEKYQQITLDEYKRTSKIDGKYNPVKFWEENRKQFPLLSRVALTVRKSKKILVLKCLNLC